MPEDPTPRDSGNGNSGPDGAQDDTRDLGAAHAPAGVAVDERPEDEEDAADGQAADEDAAEPEAPPKKGMKRSSKIALAIILTLAVIVGGALGVYFFIESSRYVSTDNAQIDGDKIAVNAPTSGTLVDWSLSEGSQLRKNSIVGRIRIQGGFVQPQQAIRSPGVATVVVNNGINGQYVAAGTQLAVAYDFSNIYVTARVDETDVDDVRAGQQVDIAVDAFPGVNFVGMVQEIQGGAAAVFSALPQSNTSGNFQKVTQVIPIRIDISNPQGLDLVPGMNVTVKIHKD